MSNSNLPLVPLPGPGGVIVPGSPGVPGAPHTSEFSVRPTSIFSRVRQLFSSGTVPQPPRVSFPPPPQVSFPQPPRAFSPQHYDRPIGVIPPIGPYRTPTPSESPVYPSPPSRDVVLFNSPDLRSVWGSVAIPSQQAPQSAVPASDDEVFIPPESSYPTGTSGIESPRSPSLARVGFPDPQIAPRQPSPPMFVHASPQPPPIQLRRTPSPPHLRSATPPPILSQPTIIALPQPDVVSSETPLILSKPVYDERFDMPGLVPPIADQPLFQVGASHRPDHLELPDFDDRQEGSSNQNSR